MLIRSLLDLYALPTGRRLFALRLIETAGVADPTLLGRVAAARAHDAKVLDAEATWVFTRNGRPAPRGGASKLDPAVDRNIGGLHARLASLVERLPEGHPARVAAQMLLNLCLPDGAAAITTLPYDEQLIQTDWLLGKLRSPEGAPLVAQAGVEIDVAALEALVPDYRKELEAMAPAGLTWDALQALRLEGRELFAKVVVRILDQWADDDATRATLMAPVLAQNAQVGESLKLRKPVADVDPGTGEPKPEA